MWLSYKFQINNQSSTLAMENKKWYDLLIDGWENYTIRYNFIFELYNSENDFSKLNLLQLTLKIFNVKINNKTMELSGSMVEFYLIVN